jgi:hypothetical protein
MPLGWALDNAPMSALHLRFWLLAGLGILLDGFDFFIIAVANPLSSGIFMSRPPRLGGDTQWAHAVVTVLPGSGLGVAVLTNTTTGKCAGRWPMRP